MRSAEVQHAWDTLSPELRAQMKEMGIDGPDDDDTPGTALYPPEQIAWHAEQYQKATEARESEAPEKPARGMPQDLAAFLDEILVWLAGAESQKSMAQRSLVLISALCPRYMEHKTLAALAREVEVSKQRLWCVSNDVRDSLNLPPVVNQVRKRSRKLYVASPTHQGVALELQLMRAWQTERSLSIKAQQCGVNVPLLSRRFRHLSCKRPLTQASHEQMTLKFQPK